MVRSRVAIIIPAYNEESTIGSVIIAVKKIGIPIVINDGSSDNTAKISSEHGAIVISNSYNLGYDEAINTGFKIANMIECKYAITIDADNQHNPEDLTKIIYLLKSGYNLVIGVRPRLQRMSEYVFSKLFKIIFSIDDPLCGLKGYDMKYYNKLGYFDSYKSIGTELMIYIAVQGGKIYNQKIDIRERIDYPRFGSLMNANYKIFRSLVIGLKKIYSK